MENQFSYPLIPTHFLGWSSAQNVTWYKKTLDQEKSKHASLAQRNGFGPAFVLHSLLAEKTGKGYRKA